MNIKKRLSKPKSLKKSAKSKKNAQKPPRYDTRGADRYQKRQTALRLEPLTLYVLRKALALTALVSVLVLLEWLRAGGAAASQKIIPLFRDMLEHVAAAALLSPALALLLDLALKKSK